MTTTYSIARIWDDGGDWGDGPNDDYSTPQAALAAAQDYVSDHIADGDYGQGGEYHEGGIEVDVWCQIISDDETVTDLPSYDERHSWTATISQEDIHMPMTVIDAAPLCGYSRYDHLMSRTDIEELIGQEFSTVAALKRGANDMWRANSDRRCAGVPLWVRVRLDTGDVTDITA